MRLFQPGKNKTSIIISGGMLEEDLVLGILSAHNDAFMIAVEGGYDFCVKNGIKSGLVLGDFDTIGDAYAKKACDEGIEVIRYPSEKDDTDTALALKEAVKRGYKNILLLGGTGTRTDHMTANIYAAAGLKKEYPDIDIIILNANNRISLRCDSYSLKKEELFGRYISFYPLGGEVKGLKLKGFKYELDGKDLLPFSYLCTSNEITDDEAFISFSSGMLLEIMSKD